MTISKFNAVKKKVMLASLHISAWTGRAFDCNATAKVEESFVNKKIGRFNKDLMPQKPKSFEDILKAGTNLRRQFDAQTLAYQQLGVRLMTTDIYLEYAKAHRLNVQKYDGLVDTFMEEYEKIQMDAKERLGKLYRSDDYPLPSELVKKFGIKFAVLPFPDADKFDIDLPDEELFAVKSDLEQNIQEAVNFAHSDLSTRLYEATLKLAQRASSDGRFHSSAINNLREIIQILPKLNFMNDARLTELADMASRELTVFDADALRTSPLVRNEIAAKATSIAHSMSTYFDLPFDESLIFNDDEEPHLRRMAA